MRLSSRRKFKYSLRDVFREMLWLHKCSSKIRYWDKIKQRKVVFDKAKENFSSETDITYIINSLRDIKLLIRTNLDEKEENLLQFYHTNLIDPTHPDSINSKYYIKNKI